MINFFFFNLTQNQMFYGYDSPGACMAWFQALNNSSKYFRKSLWEKNNGHCYAPIYTVHSLITHHYQDAPKGSVGGL